MRGRRSPVVVRCCVRLAVTGVLCKSTLAAAVRTSICEAMSCIVLYETYVVAYLSVWQIAYAFELEGFRVLVRADAKCQQQCTAVQ
jgi:hypothetical protein